jgi:hypothetical protein
MFKGFSSRLVGRLGVSPEWGTTIALLALAVGFQCVALALTIAMRLGWLT